MMEIDDSEVTRIDEFWNWFRSNSPRMVEVKAGNHRSLEGLEERLAKIYEGLMFEVSGDETSQTLVISADGIRERIPHVFATVQRAPQDIGWEVLAFRQRVEPKFSLSFNGLTIDFKDLWFELGASDQKIDVRVHVPPEIDTEAKDSIHISFIVLDILLGEYDVMTKMGLFDLMHVPAYPEQCGLIPAERLAEEFDKLWLQISGRSEAD